MGFYLRKSFRLGPLRINLSKHGLGVSAGVRGARLGITSDGRTYVHAGRGGIYYRRYFGGPGKQGSGPATAALPAESLTLYEDTGVTYPAASTPQEVPLSRVDPHSLVQPGRVMPQLLVLGAVLLLVSLVTGDSLTPLAGFFLQLAAIFSVLAGVVIRLREKKRQRALEKLLETAYRAVKDLRPLAPESLETLEKAMANGILPTAAVAAAVRSVYADTVLAMVDDRRVTAEERELLRQLESFPGLDDQFRKEARVAAFQEVYLAAVSDRNLTEQEEEELEQVLTALEIPREAVKEQLDVLEQLKEVRALRAGELPVVEAEIRLARGETCHFRAPGRLLKERNLRTFSHQGRRVRVRGLILEKEGTLYITSRRILLVHGGSTSWPLRKILDLELDADRNLLLITRDGVQHPLLLTTPEALRAASVIALLADL